jgi:hypothetical protein
MVSSVMPYAKKLFSLALLFNAVLTLEYAIQILTSFYRYYPVWKFFPPLIFDGSLFWLLVPVALLNFYPAVSTGQTKCSRLWFHHYVYGFAIAVVAGVLLLAFTSVPIIDLISRDIPNISINVGRFFVLGGLTLVIDDLPDMSRGLKRSLGYLKLKAYQTRKLLHAVQLVFGFVALYFCIGVIAHIYIRPSAFTLANIILMGTLLVTFLTAVISFKRKIWLNIKPDETKNENNCCC